jgi:hypothetical protein
MPISIAWKSVSLLKKSQLSFAKIVIRKIFINYNNLFSNKIHAYIPSLNIFTFFENAT